MKNARSDSGLLKKKPFKVLVCLVTLVAFLFNTVSYDLAWAANVPMESTGVGSNQTSSPGLIKELHVNTFTL